MGQNPGVSIEFAMSAEGHSCRFGRRVRPIYPSEPTCRWAPGYVATGQ